MNGRHLMSPSPIPAFDTPKMDGMAALQLFGAGREKRLYAIPPYTERQARWTSTDHPFRLTRAPHVCTIVRRG